MPDTLARDIAALCRAVDGGDDSALPVLADAMEEAGDPRAAGLRHLLGQGYLTYLDWASWSVHRSHAGAWDDLLMLADRRDWDRLETTDGRGRMFRHGRGVSPDIIQSMPDECGLDVRYLTRIAAILALAEALSHA